jgi:hypothetical protein
MRGKAFFATGALAGAIACSGSSPGGGGMCPAVAPCGGDLGGTWKLVSACGVGTGTVNEQAGCMIDVSDAISSASGTYVFNADGTYMVEESLSENDTFTFPSACFSSNGVAATCAQVASALDSDADDYGSHPIGVDVLSRTRSLRVRSLARNFEPHGVRDLHHGGEHSDGHTVGSDGCDHRLMRARLQPLHHDQRWGAAAAVVNHRRAVRVHRTHTPPSAQGLG